MESLTDDFKQLLTDIKSNDSKHPTVDDIVEAFNKNIKTTDAKDKAKKWLRDYHETSKKHKSRSKHIHCKYVCWYVGFPVLMALIWTPILVPELREVVLETIYDTECLIDSNYFLQEMGRPIFNCNVCKDMKQVPVMINMTKEEFIEKYAYKAIPILVKQATVNWTALETFSFEFFRDLYHRYRQRIREENKNLKFDEDKLPMNPTCQFFPYNTEFDTLLQAMAMSEKRAAYEPGEKPWYFGWSNCDTDSQTELREHYQRPYFLPEDSETSSIDWIFMGGNGKGAPIHLDSVSRPSWQAQISGTKTWTLTPVPECEDVCHTMNVTVHQGDIIVVDTNQWYHATYIHPGPLSITIGSEYD